jgi:hypothetical protein
VNHVTLYSNYVTFSLHQQPSFVAHTLNNKHQTFTVHQKLKTMKKIFPLINRACFAVLALCIIFQMESCVQHKGIMQCPTVSYMGHHDKLYTHAWHTGISKPHADQKNTTATANMIDSSSITPAANAIAPEGYANSNNDVPATQRPMDMFKSLSAEQRLQVKDQVSSMLDKNKIVKGAILKRLDKMDKKYPAPPPAQAYEGGHRLSTGEILSIVAIACAVTWALGILGLILGAIALVKINREGGARWARILAIIAIVLGAIAFLSFFGYLIFIVI